MYFSQQGPVTASESTSLTLSVLLPAHVLAPVPDASLPVLQTNTTELPAPKPLQDFRYVYTHRPKVPASESVPADSSPVEGSPPQPSAPSSDLNVPLPSAKVNDHVLIIVFLILFPMISFFSPICHVFVFCLYS